MGIKKPSGSEETLEGKIVIKTQNIIIARMPIRPLLIKGLFMDYSPGGIRCTIPPYVGY
jgi:hypothetical protein